MQNFHWKLGTQQYFNNFSTTWLKNLSNQIWFFYALCDISALLNSVSVTCPNVTQKIEHGTVSYIQTNLLIPNSYGTSAFVMCDLGYINAHPLSAVCQADGTWSATLGWHYQLQFQIWLTKLQVDFS